MSTLKFGFLKNGQIVFPRKDGNGQLINDFNDHTDFTNLGTGTVSTDTSVFYSGNASVKCTLGTAENVNLRLNITATDFRKKSLLIRWKFADRTALSSSQVLLHVGTTLVTLWENQAGQWTHGGTDWWEMCLNAADLNDPSADISAIDNIRFRVAGTATDVWMDECRIIDNVFPGQVAIVFDDGNETDYTIAKPILDTAGYVGTSYIRTDVIDTVGKLSTAQIQELYAAGWDIGSHSNTHIDFQAATESAIIDECVNSIAILNGVGVQPKTFAFPFNLFDDLALEVCGRYFKVLSGAIQRASAPSLEYTKFTPRYIPEVFATSADFKAELDNFALHGGYVEILYHEIGVDTSQADFQDQIDHIKNNTNLVVTTSSRRYLK